MGLASWIAAALAAFGVARFHRAVRLAAYAELLIVLVVGFLAGVSATALDFGGWSILEWRAILFAFLCALGSIALARLPRLARQRQLHRV